MRFPNEAMVKKLRDKYPVGCRVKLLEMDDVQAPPIGTLGTVQGVDDTGSIMVCWDNGSGLNVIYGVDRCCKLSKCPLCGEYYQEPPAISRADNKTKICSSCGTREALRDAGINGADEEHILNAIYKK